MAPNLHNKMDPKEDWRYIFDSPFIIRYIERKIEDVFTVRFANYNFDESLFSKLVEENKNHDRLGYPRSIMRHASQDLAIITIHSHNKI